MFKKKVGTDQERDFLVILDFCFLKIHELFFFLYALEYIGEIISYSKKKNSVLALCCLNDDHHHHLYRNGWIKNKTKKKINYNACVYVCVIMSFVIFFLYMW